MEENASEVYDCYNQQESGGEYNVPGTQDEIKESTGNIISDDTQMFSLSAAHQAMKSLKDIIPPEFSRDQITQAADELIASLNAKRKQDTGLLADFKKTAELQTRRTCTVVEQNMFQIYEKQGKIMQEKIQDLNATLERISKLETKIQECKRALQGLCLEFNE